VTISTLEHVGMDNSYYGAAGTEAEDPAIEAARALMELHRVLRPGGELYLTLPVGAAEHYGWVRALSPGELQALVEAAPWAAVQTTFYRHGPRGWALARSDEIAAARYRDHFTSGPPGEDRVVAAEAVACVRLTR
jgi:SAM-dependent methyltransferase